jgi:hypothetical protein
VIPDSFALGAAHQAFGAEGGLRYANAETAVHSIGATLVGTLDKIRGIRSRAVGCVTSDK